MPKKVKTIRLKVETWKRLKQLGKMVESFDDLVNRILDERKNLGLSEPVTRTPEAKKLEKFPLKTEETQRWNEKYRPKILDDMVGDKNLLSKLKAFVQKRNIPNLFLHGSVGVGKTSAAHCIVNELYGEYAHLSHKVYNAVEITKEEVRSTIKKLATTKSIAQSKVGVPYRVCIIDECEKISSIVETMLRKLIDIYSSNIRFILICNDIKVKAITKPILSRCTVLKFKPLTKGQIFKRISYIAKNENSKITEEELRKIAKEAKGDLRKAIDTLQMRSMLQMVTGDKNFVDTILSEILRE